MSIISYYGESTHNTEKYNYNGENIRIISIEKTIDLHGCLLYTSDAADE